MAQLALTNQLSSSIRPYIVPKYVDQIYGNIRLWNYLKKIGDVQETVGGALEFHVPIIYKEVNRAKWLTTPTDTVNTAAFDVVRTMSFEWTEAMVAVTLTDLTDLIPTMGAGNEKVIEHVQGKFDLAGMDMSNLLGQTIYDGDPSLGNGTPLGFNMICDSTGTFGNLPRATYPVLAGNENAIGGNTSIADLRLDTITQTRGNDEPELYVTEADTFSAFATVIADNLRFTPEDGLPGPGIRPIIVNGRQMIWDDPVTANDVLILNLSGFKMRVHRSFNMDVGDFIEDRQSGSYTSKTRWAGVWCHEKPSLCGKQTGVTGVV
jgi:hypothetical protein